VAARDPFKQPELLRRDEKQRESLERNHRAHNVHAFACVHCDLDKFNRDNRALLLVEDAITNEV
jgi:hypothetical protein